MSARRWSLLLLVLAVSAAACTATPRPSVTPRPDPTPSPAPSPTRASTPTPTATPTPTVSPSRAPTPTPTVSPTPAPFGGALPLPPDLGPDAAPPVGEVASVSLRSLVPGSRVAYTLGHCGLYSPVDLDGSLWEPIGAIDAEGGPVDSEAEVGDLINATAGVALLVDADRLHWRADRSGVVVVFDRLPGSRGYPGCQ